MIFSIDRKQLNYISINFERLNHDVFLYLLIINDHNMVEYQDSILESKLFSGSDYSLVQTNQKRIVIQIA